jgi:hypothetical protein
MKWLHRLNRALARATGFEVRRAWRPRKKERRQPAPPPGPGDRLVTAPTFILCSLRSGSTLLRVLLNSHSKIHSPQELHLRHVGVKFRSKWAAKAMRALNLDAPALEYLLWDRVLHRELTNSGKELIVCKTPNDVFNADRIRECWPDARFIFLLRHPASIAASRASLWERGVDPERNAERIRRYCEALEVARQKYEGYTVRYEDVTADPEGTTRRLCNFLGVDWEPDMLDYGRFDHGQFRAGLGDWKDKIRTGQIQPPRPLPTAEETPPVLRNVAIAWGYLTDGQPAAERADSAAADREATGSASAS